MDAQLPGAEGSHGARETGEWALVREAGLEYGEEPVAGVELHSPVAAERFGADGLLVVDDLSADGDPLRMRCRTLVLDREGKVELDCGALGLDDAYGCVVGERIALLRGSTPELLLLSRGGAIERRVDLSGVSRHPGRLVTATPDGSLFVAFLGFFQELAFAEVDASGRVVWATTNTTPPIGIPGSLQRQRDDSLLVADEFHNVVWSLKRDGSAQLVHGIFRQPSARPGALHRPRCARRLDDGSLLVADAHNHRVLVVGDGRAPESLRLADGEFLAPAHATLERDGTLLVCDAGNRCVLEIGAGGRIVRRIGAPPVRRRHLSFPRSAFHRGGAHYLVADSAQDRVVDVEEGSFIPRALAPDSPLFWPRSARATAAGGLVVADGRNARILETDARGQRLRELREVCKGGRRVALDDPHDARPLADGSLLVVDSAAHFVAKVGWDGSADWIVGRDFGHGIRDPHSAQPLPDGRVLIADRGNDRILLIDPRTGKEESFGTLRSGEVEWRLDSPRQATLAADGTLVIVDTGASRVLLTRPALDTVEVIAAVPGSPRPSLRLPRWVDVISRDELVVSDYHNHRLVHLRRRAA